MEKTIEEEIIEMQNRAKRRKSKWNLLLIPFNVFFVSIFSYWYYKLILIIMNISLISRDDIVYIYYPNTIWNIVLILIILISSLVLSFIVSNFILWIIKPIRDIFEEESKLNKWTDYKSTQKKLLKILPIILLIWFPIIYMYINTYSALSYKWLVYNNSWYQLSEKEYNISDELEKIKISVAKYNNNSDKLFFKFIMKDGKNIEFSEWNEIEFLNKYWEFEPYLEELLKFNVFYDVDKISLDRLLNQPKFDNEYIKNRLLDILSEIDIEYENWKKILENNPNDDLFKIEFGFYEILKNWNYKEWLTLYSWLNNLKEIEICDDNKCLSKISIKDYEEKIKSMFLDKYWVWNHINLAYQNFLISIISWYIESEEYRKAYFYNGRLISEFIQELDINSYYYYSKIFNALTKEKVEKYKKYVLEFDRIPWDMILWDIQLHYDDIWNTFYTTRYSSSYYYNQLGLFYEYLNKYEEAIVSYEKAYKLDNKWLLTLKNLCISKYLDTKSKIFLESDKLKYKKWFEKSLKYCLDYENKYENLYLDKKWKSFYENIKYKWDYEILNYIWLNYWFLKKLDLSEQYYKKSLENWWKEIKLYNNLAVIYEDKWEDIKAIEYYKKALKINENDYNTLVNIGKLYWKLEDYENAISYILNVREIVSTTKINNKFRYKINPYNDYLLCLWYDKQYWKQNTLWNQYCYNYLEYSKNDKLKIDKEQVKEVENIIKI